MASSDCAHCGAGIAQSVAGRPREYCSTQCLQEARYPKKSGKCATCGRPVEPVRRKNGGWKEPTKYCSALCKRRETRRRQKERADERECEACGKPFKSRAKEQRLCSLACSATIAVAAATKARKAKAKARRKWRQSKEQKAVRAEVAALRRIARRGGAVRYRVIAKRRVYEKKAAMADRPCKACGGPVGYVFGRARKFCESCAAWSTASLFQSMIEYRVLGFNRRHETFSRFDVFEHYGWHCAACDVETPAYMVGSDPLNPRAPVVDHILPIARGGNHTWANVQLLCRSCNTIKGDKLNSELLDLVALKKSHIYQWDGRSLK